MGIFTITAVFEGQIVYQRETPVPDGLNALVGEAVSSLLAAAVGVDTNNGFVQVTQHFEDDSKEQIELMLFLDEIEDVHFESEALEIAKGKVRTMSGDKHKPRKLKKDSGITPEEASKRIKFRNEYFDADTQEWYIDDLESYETSHGDRMDGTLVNPETNERVEFEEAEITQEFTIDPIWEDEFRIAPYEEEEEDELIDEEEEEPQWFKEVSAEGFDDDGIGPLYMAEEVNANPMGGSTGDQVVQWEESGLSSPSAPPSDIFWAEDRPRDNKGRLVPKFGVTKWGNDYWDYGVSYQEWKWRHPASVRVFAEGYGVDLKSLTGKQKDWLEWRYKEDVDSKTALFALIDEFKIKTKKAETFMAEEEPFIVRGTWGGGVVEFSNGDVFVKVISFPVTDDSDYAGESMWVLLEEGNEFEGIGILDNDPFHSEIKCGSRIKFTGGNTHYKPHFVAVMEAESFAAEGELDDKTIEMFIARGYILSPNGDPTNPEHWRMSHHSITPQKDTGTWKPEKGLSGVRQPVESSRGKYCKTCQVKGHDSCSLTEGCPCCENTMMNIYDADYDIRLTDPNSNLWKGTLKEKKAETLGKDSCCCGATKADPCACMIKGVMDCSATCPCSRVTADQMRMKGAESFSADFSQKSESFGAESCEHEWEDTGMVQQAKGQGRDKRYWSCHKCGNTKWASHLRKGAESFSAELRKEDCQICVGFNTMDDAIEGTVVLMGNHIEDAHSMLDMLMMCGDCQKEYLNHSWERSAESFAAEYDWCHTCNTTKPQQIGFVKCGCGVVNCDNCRCGNCGSCYTVNCGTRDSQGCCDSSPHQGAETDFSAESFSAEEPFICDECGQQATQAKGTNWCINCENEYQSGLHNPDAAFGAESIEFRSPLDDKSDEIL